MSKDMATGWGAFLPGVHFAVRLPYELAPGITIRRASPAQIEFIQHAMAPYTGEHQRVRDGYEYNIVPPPPPGGAVTKVELAPPDWRYYVYEFSAHLNVHNDLDAAASMSLAPVRMNAFYEYRSANISGGFGRSPKVIQDAFETYLWARAPLTVLGEAELKDLANAFSLLMERKGEGIGEQKYPELFRALGLLSRLDLLGYGVFDFRVIGLFAVIEMLVTHNPKLEDRGDSITHQMRSKLPLLFRRFPNPVDVADHYPGGDAKKLWGYLYGYRSVIAHGGIAAFDKGDLQKLKSPGAADRFLTEVVRKLIRHAFTEPDLYRDLREC